MLIKQVRVALCVCGCFLMCHMSALPQMGSLLGDYLESIVCSLLSKLHSVATFTLVQSLLMVLCTSCTLSSAGGHPLLPGVGPLHQWTVLHGVSAVGVDLSTLVLWQVGDQDELTGYGRPAEILPSNWGQTPGCHRDSWREGCVASKGMNVWCGAV